jgi:glc operon protein GlcG
MKNRKTLDHHDAWIAINAAQAEIEKRGQAAVIAVVDTHGEVLASLRHVDAMLSSLTLAHNKAYAAARLRRPTSAIGAKMRDEGLDISSFGDPRFTGFGGGLPIIVDGELVGAIGISGLPEAEDIAIAELAIKAMMERW